MVMLCVPAPLPVSICKRLMVMRKALCRRRYGLRWKLIERSLQRLVDTETRS